MKHYLRGEDGIHYEDLYYLVKFLPAYAFPRGLMSRVDLVQQDASEDPKDLQREKENERERVRTSGTSDRDAAHVQFPGMSNVLAQRNNSNANPPSILPIHTSPTSPHSTTARSPNRPSTDPEKASLPGDASNLLPARQPPAYSLFDLFPFSILVRALTINDKNVGGRKAARLRAKQLRSGSHDLPLEISLYLVSFWKVYWLCTGTDDVCVELVCRRDPAQENY